jgi:long-chain acyl-CoA synthetase
MLGSRLVPADWNVFYFCRMTEALGLWKIAEDEPDKLALVDPNERHVSYRELAAMANQLSHGLRGLGLDRGGGIAVALPNSVDFLALYFAAMQIGLYFTPINWHLAGPEIAYIVDDSEASVFIAHEEFADAATIAAKDVGLSPDRLFAVGDIAGFRQQSCQTASRTNSPPIARPARTCNTRPVLRVAPKG